MDIIRCIYGCAYVRCTLFIMISWCVLIQANPKKYRLQLAAKLILDPHNSEKDRVVQHASLDV